MNLFETKLILALVVIINCCGLLVPTLHYGDGYTYALISKEMLINGNWANLTYHNVDWLDKPHFPFWITVLSYKLFGVNSFSYVLPGFLFHLLGAYYLFKLAKRLFDDKIAYLATLIFLSSIGVMIYSIDIRAEAFLLGETIPACYYLLKYYHNFQIKSLILSAFFVAIALMTKGLMILLPVFGGVFLLAIYSNQIRDFFSIKWLIWGLLTFLMIIPELYCLYLQFDLHPEKIVHGQHNVSGVMWFFYGSQFGRFFNNGYIVDTRSRHFFYIGTFIWTFFPWSIVLIESLFSKLSKKKINFVKLSPQNAYLHGSYLIPIVFFMLTNFQREYYLIIVYPFISIISANIICKKPEKLAIGIVNKSIITLISILIGGFTFQFILNGASNWLIICIAIAFCNVSCLFLDHAVIKKRLLLAGNIACSLSIFIFLMGAKIFIDHKYNIGYDISKKLAANEVLHIYNDMPYRLQDPILFHNSKVVILTRNQLLESTNLVLVGKAELTKFAPYNYNVLGEFLGLRGMKLLPALVNRRYLSNNEYHYSLLYITSQK